MTFLCPHGKPEGRICWDCKGYAIPSTVVDFTDDDILKFVPKRLRQTAVESLLGRLDGEHKAELLFRLT